jgi:YVTN family beta-propeller protein
MRTRLAAVLSILSLAGCQMAARTVKPAPLDADGEVWVYVDALPAQSGRLQFTLESVAATRSDGQEFPLSLVVADLSGKADRRQRLLARGRVSPGQYTGLSVRVKKATLEVDDGPAANLLVPTEPVKITVPFSLARAHIRVVSLQLDPARSLDKGFGFRPAFGASVPAMPLVELAGFATDTGSDAVTVFEKRTRQVVAVLPTGRDPRGLAVDFLQSRLYVALSAADEVAAYDLLTGEELGRARLQPGDHPQEVGLSADRRVLVVTNPGSNSASFVDPLSLVEVGRARTGVQPTALLMDRFGRRAYAFNQGSNSITVLDVGARAAAGSISVDGPPARGSLNRAGDRLYVVSPSSAYMTTVAIPTLATANRTYVGFGALSVLVDPRTDYVYVSMGDAGELQLFAPFTPLPIGRIALPGAATWLTIDDTYDTLLAVVPSRNGLLAMEFTSQVVYPLIDAGEAPYAISVVADRH